MSELIKKLIAENEKNKDKFLDLGNCGLTKLSNKLFEINYLEGLNLGFQYYNDEKQEGRLTKNQEKNNQLTGRELRKLTKLPELKKLFLHNTIADADISFLEKLPTLQTLDLSNNHIQDAHFLENLTALHTLDLSNNQIQDVGVLENLTALHTLYLSNNQIHDISFLEKLTALHTLHLSNNQIQDYSFLEKLTALHILDLSDNHIQKIDFLEKLTALHTLDLRNNQIQEISFLEKFTDLHTLDLRNNQIQKITTAFLDKLLNLKTLYLFGNPIKGIPTEILGKNEYSDCLIELKEYLQSIEKKEDQKELNEAKLIFVGVGEVGKSELVEALSEPNYQFVQGRETTKGIRIKKWLLEGCKKQGKTIDFRANIWDFAGQEINYGTHQFFLTKNSVYVFVWETRKGEEESKFAYWLNVVSLLSENAPIFVVQNKTDIYTSEINQADWKKKFPNIVDFYKTSCKNGSGIDILRADIERELLALPHTFEIWNKDRYAIRENLEQSPENYISHKTYLKICEQKNLTTEQASFLSKQFHDIGVILHYPNDFDLKSTVVLKPEWATQAAYCLLLNNQHVKNGKFSTSDLASIWTDEKFDEKQPFLLSLMKKFELIFQFQESEIYILPERLPIEQPILPQPKGEERHLRFEYHYDFMPKGVLSRFICRMYESIKDELFWKYGVVLKYESSEAIVISSEVDKQIRIEVYGNEADKLLAMIRREIEVIHEKLKNPKLTERIPCVCDECRESKTPYFHKYEVLIRFKEKGKKTKECEKSGLDVDISALLEGILDTKKVNRDYLLELIDGNEIPKFYQELDRLGVSQYDISRLQKEFIYKGGDFEYADKLKVWVMSNFGR